MPPKLHLRVIVELPSQCTTSRLFHASTYFYRNDRVFLTQFRRKRLEEPKHRDGDHFSLIRKHVRRDPPERLKRLKGTGEESTSSLTAPADMATRSWAHVAGGGGQIKMNENNQQRTAPNFLHHQDTDGVSVDHTLSQPSNPQSQGSHRGAYTASEYQRPSEQTPNTANPAEELHYIVTITTDDKLHKIMTSLRDTFFPSHLNKLAAHIAMFRALPGSERSLVEATLEDVCDSTISFKISTESKPFAMRHGVGVNMEDGKRESQLVYRQCKNKWDGFLSQQDKGFRPHWTIQNKEYNEKAVERCMRETEWHLARTVTGNAVGLCFWQFDKGYWKFIRKFPFRGQSTPKEPPLDEAIKENEGRDVDRESMIESKRFKPIV